MITANADSVNFIAQCELFINVSYVINASVINSYVFKSFQFMFRAKIM